MNIMPSPSNIGSMKTNPYRKCIKLEGLQVETSSLNYKVVNRIPVMAPILAPLLGVQFLGGRIFLKNWT
jgi:hypothetical protein